MCSPCLCTLSTSASSASIHPLIPTFGRFLLEIFFFVSALFCYAPPPTHLRLIRHPRTYTMTTALKLCCSYAQTPSAKCTPPDNFLTTGGCFECNTYRITALGWLNKEEEDDEQSSSDF